jgi:hypothetical protein
VENATLDLAKVVGSKLCKMTQKQMSDFKKVVLPSTTVQDILLCARKFLVSLTSFIDCGFPWIDEQHTFIIA